MKRKLKIIAWSLSGLVLAILIAAFFVPIFGVRTHYCFHCGVESHDIRILGISLWQPAGRSTHYRDRLELPEHRHAMIVLNGSKVWVFRGDEHWDDFGWSGSSCRGALMDGLRAFPDRRDSLIEEFMRLDALDGDAQKRFRETYSIGSTEE